MRNVPQRYYISEHLVPYWQHYMGEILEPLGDEGLLWKHITAGRPREYLHCHACSLLSLLLDFCWLSASSFCCLLSCLARHCANPLWKVNLGKLPSLRSFWARILSQQQTTGSDGLVVLLPCSNHSLARILLHPWQRDFCSHLSCSSAVLSLLSSPPVNSFTCEQSAHVTLHYGPSQKG